MLLALENAGGSEVAHAVLVTCYMDGIDPDEPMATVRKQFDLRNLH